MRIVILYFLFPLIILLLIFYKWGSSGSLDQELLHQEISLDSFDNLEGDTFSIMTYNIGYLSGMTNNLPVKPVKNLFEDNLVKSQALIGALQPDIIGFQEIDFASSRSYHVNQLESLSYGYQAAVKSVNWDKKYVPFPYWPPSTHFGKMQSGQALLSKFPISWSKRIVLSRPEKAPFYYQAFYLDRLIQVAELKIKGQSVIILNIHLEAFDQKTREAQATEVLNVIEEYISSYPVILIGDFNARPPFASNQVSQETTISIFMQHPLLSSALSRTNYLAHEEGHYTFDTAAPYEKLDYIFYSHERIELVDVSTVTEAIDISDHFPFLMRFTMRTN